MDWRTIEGWFDEENYKMLQTIKLPENPVILESGTHKGKSTNVLAELWPDSKIFTCDPEDYKPILPENATFYNCETVNLRWDQWGKSIDLLFIDNSHQMEDIRDDWDKYEPFVNVGGYIVLHDYHKEHTTVDDVRDFVDSLPKDKITIFTDGEFGGAIYRK